MKTFIFALFFTTPALAHIEPGLYVGAMDDGATCQFRAIRQYYEGDIPHPLREKIVIETQGVEFTVGHPAVIDNTTKLAHFNHDLFQGVVPTSKGAQALTVEMLHSGEAKGPTAFTFLNHEWRADQRASVVCKNLKFQGR